eukprot:4615536-Prymnesium_polylepis.3
MLNGDVLRAQRERRTDNDKRVQHTAIIASFSLRCHRTADAVLCARGVRSKHDAEARHDSLQLVGRSR